VWCKFLVGNAQLKEFNHLVELQQELTRGWIKYWNRYSSFDDWHFWFMIVLFILPLITLFFLIDRRKVFHLGFFGFNIHVWQTYLDISAVELGKWTYPYKQVPFLPISFSFDASFIPVTFMLVYQWTLNKKKNFYLYATLPAFFFAFIAKPILVGIHITKAGPNGGGLNSYIVLFISHLLVSYLSKWITDIFRKSYVKVNEEEQQSPKSLNWFRLKKLH
jgi:hypothetical protein